jgi:hypothetical protein
MMTRRIRRAARRRKSTKFCRSKNRGAGAWSLGQAFGSFIRPLGSCVSLRFPIALLCDAHLSRVGITQWGPTVSHITPSDPAPGPRPQFPPNYPCFPDFCRSSARFPRYQTG